MQWIRHLILDMDGVLWRGETPLPGLPDFFAVLRRLGINFVLATNNATKSAEQYVARLAGYGVDIEAWRILGSAETTAIHLSRHYPPAAAIYAIGEAGLHQELRRRNLSVVNAPGQTADLPRQVDLVVVGLSRQVCYAELAQAGLYISRGAAFIGANPDVSLPTENGPLPGAGALLALLEAATGIRPIIIGKPSPIMFQTALQRLNAPAAATAMVGDRLETDIQGAQAVGLSTILVLSGVTTPDQLAAAAIRPDYVFTDINALAAALQAAHTPTRL